MIGTMANPDQGRSEVRLRPGQETSLVPLCSNLSSFRSLLRCLSELLLSTARPQ